MPKLWDDTIESHRRAVHEAVLDAVSGLVAAHGFLSVTMSQIASEAGVGRATLYKYFADVEAVFVAWHERQVVRHLEHLADVRDRASDPEERLEAVLQALAEISHEIAHANHSPELGAVLHRGEHVVRAQQKLNHFMRDLLAENAKAGHIRDDVSPEELSIYCLHALSGASGLRSKPAVRRLVAVTIAGLQRRG